MSTQRILTTIVVAAVAAIAGAGCGGSSSHSSGSQSTTAAAPSMSTAGYVALVRSAGDKIDAARRSYFRGKSDRASQVSEVRRVKSAYDAAIARLQGVHPPAAGRSIHSQILSGMRRLSAKLGAVLSAKPFRASRANDLLAHDGDQLGLVLSQVYTIP